MVDECNTPPACLLDLFQGQTPLCALDHIGSLLSIPAVGVPCNSGIDPMSRVRDLHDLGVQTADEPASRLSCKAHSATTQLHDPHTLLQVRLFNGSALANMRMGRFDEAEQALQEALEKDPKSADTLANLITVSLHLGKPVSRHSKWVTAS